MLKKAFPMAIVFAGLALPGPVLSQQQATEEAPPTVVLSLFKCDWTRMQDIMSDAEAQLPFLERQKTAGNIIDAGTYVHAWGDEWNFGRYIIASGMAAAVAANAAANQAFAAANPTRNAVGEACATHRDNFYVAGAGASSASAATGGNPTLVMTFSQCVTSRLGDVMAEYESVVIPVYQALVDEGRVRSAGSFAHAWADEWNVGFFVVAEDVPTFLEAWREANSRMGPRPVAGEACSAHKDNIYTLGPRTGG